MEVQLFFTCSIFTQRENTHKYIAFLTTQKFYWRNSLIISGCFMHLHCICIASALQVHIFLP
nr:MAG TPA: hypothetical protein [Caudoviricetes sp.]